VSFRSQFSASQDKAHNRNIATKIYEDLSKLRAAVDVSPTTPKRWIWELIQNAKDVNIEGKVRVRIEADLDGADAHITFKHNGGAFSPENIRFLIEQVSSKDRTIDSTGRPTTTGRFGTGFLTTHLLSENVLVNGVVKEQGLAPRKFELSLDRSGGELEEIIAAVEAAKDSMQDLDDRPARSSNSNTRPKRSSSSTFHCSRTEGGVATTMVLAFLRRRSSRVMRPASIVFPRPVSSAMKRLTRGRRSALRSGSIW